MTKEEFGFSVPKSRRPLPFRTDSGTMAAVLPYSHSSNLNILIFPLFTMICCAPAPLPLAAVFAGAMLLEYAYGGEAPLAAFGLISPATTSIWQVGFRC